MNRTSSVAFIAAAAIALAGSAWAAPLRVGVMPDADSLPLLVAEAEGLFEAAGVSVSLVPFKTAVERDAALQAGALEGAVSDLLAVALSRQGGFDIRATSLTDGRYGLAVGPNSRIASLSALAGVPVGISSNTIIQYAAETMIGRAGVATSDIKSLAVPKIQLRMELLLAGQLEAACLPEPLLSVARAKGARVLAASDDSGLGAGVIVFSRPALDSRARDIAAFYKAYRKAALEIDEKPDSYRGFLIDKAGFPVEAKEAFSFVKYKEPRLPSDSDIASVLEWMRAKGIAAGSLDPRELVDGGPIAEASKGW
jgi:ABC-type nitrate/sulfonate/bicarbonate transport systems, periplasmic components